MTLNFCVADCFYTLEFVEETIDYRKLLSSSGAFFVKECRDSPIFHMVIEKNLIDTQGKNLEEIGFFSNGDMSHQVWRQPNGGYRIQVNNVNKEVACVLNASADFSECKVSVWGSLENQSFGLNNALMIAFAFAGAQHRTLLLHTSVPMKEGKAFLFQGKSGTGKSTHCQLWLKHIEGTDLLNDDNPAVRLDESGKVYVYGTPWSGKTPCYRNLRQEAGAFLRLHQAPYNKIRQYSKIEAFASILSSSSTMIWDKLSYNAICNTISGIVGSTPAFYLECLPNEEAAILSYEHLVKKNDE